MHARDEMAPEELAFHERVNAIYLRKQDIPFPEVVAAYRAVEAEFVERAHGNEQHVVETKRRISEWLLEEAARTKQSFDVCRSIWEELIARGFSDPYKHYVMAGIYVRCCQHHAHWEDGLSVLASNIVLVEEWSNDPTLDSEMRDYWEQQRNVDYKLRDALRAKAST